MTSPSRKRQGFNYADADIILVSAIGQAEPRQFKVHKNILSIASPVFETMFSLPQADATQIQTVECSETEETLDLLLQYIYPLPDPKLEDLDQLSNLIDAAVKYEIKATVQSLRKLLSGRNLLTNCPIEVYGIALRHRFTPEFELALKATLGKRLTGKAFEKEIAFLPSASSLYLLTEYHRLFFTTVSQNYSKILGNQRRGSCEKCESLIVIAAVLDRRGGNTVFEDSEQLIRALENRTDQMFQCGHVNARMRMNRGYEKLRDELKGKMEAYDGESFTLQIPASCMKRSVSYQ